MPKKVEIVEMPEALQVGPKTQNIFEVPKRQWRKWNNQARYVFNEHMNQTQGQVNVKHPEQELMPKHHWDTIQWNTAWLAADAVMETVKGYRPTGPNADPLPPEVAGILIDTLKRLYIKAGLQVPHQLNPVREAARLARALRDPGQTARIAELEGAIRGVIDCTMEPDGACKCIQHAASILNRKKP